MPSTTWPAGPTSGGSWKAPVEAFRVNAEGTLNVLSAAAEAGVERVLAVSSADVYGKVDPSELPLTEDSPLRPASPYAASKVAADYLGLQAWLGNGLPVLRVRAFNHLGPGQTDKFVAPAIASRIARAELGEGSDVLPIGDLSARRDFTDVRDVVRAYRLLMEHGEPGEVYNVCSGVDLAVQDLADQLLAQARIPLRFETDPALLRPVEVPVLRGSYQRLSRSHRLEARDPHQPDPHRPARGLAHRAPPPGLIPPAPVRPAPPCRTVAFEIFHPPVGIGGVMAIPTAPIVAGSLIGGYYVARTSKNRKLGAAVLGVGGVIAKTEWMKTSGPVTTAVLSGIFYGGFGLSHPLAKKIGAWPAVLTVAGVAATSAYVLNDRKARQPPRSRPLPDPHQVT